MAPTKIHEELGLRPRTGSTGPVWTGPGPIPVQFRSQSTGYNMIAVGWLDNKAVNFVSTSDTIAMKSVLQRVGSERIEMPAPEAVCNYKKYMRGVNCHDWLCSTFSLGKWHKFRKYYVKLSLFLVDIALTNGWIYYKLSHEKLGEKYGDKADFYIQLANEMIQQDID